MVFERPPELSAGVIRRPAVVCNQEVAGAR